MGRCYTHDENELLSISSPLTLASDMTLLYCIGGDDSVAVWTCGGASDTSPYIADLRQ